MYVKDLAAADSEENRVLDLYRENLISRERLGEQLAKVQDKRKCLDDEMRAVSAKLEGSNHPGLDNGDVTQYCKSIRQRLKGLSGDFEGKRRIMALLVNNIVLEGKTVRIRGVIPAVPQQNGPETGENPCRIASLIPGGRV